MYKIYFPDCFKKQLKRLKKKFPSVKSDILNAFENFDIKTSIKLGHKLYKIRIKSSDSKSGKRGSFRVIVLLKRVKNLLIPIAIFHKSDKENLTQSEVEKYIDSVLNEIQTWKL
jgi:hypothetical protein